MPSSPLRVPVFAFLSLTLFAGSPEVAAQDAPRVVEAVRVNTSEPLRDIPARPGTHRSLPHAVPNKFHRFGGHGPLPAQPGFADPLVGRGDIPTRDAAVVLDFDGASQDDNVLALGGGVLPPDTNGDVGPNHYVQWINLVAKFYGKDGTLLLGPVPGNHFFEGLGGPCDDRNDGDPVVLYDERADRWVAMQFMLAQLFTGSGGYALCMAVSTTPDPTGPYHQYEFPFDDFPDYPKIGVGADAYYATTRSFGDEFRQEAVAFERAAMLVGGPAQMVLFFIPDDDPIDGFLPADLDGAAPAEGAPGLFGGIPIDVPEIRLYGLTPDWDEPAASTFELVAALPVASFSRSVSGVPQPSPGPDLASLTFLLMHRLQYRVFDDREVLMLNHTVNVGGGRAGVRWYELQDTGAGWGLHQQGTYAPGDGLDRWLGSVAMNGDGDIGLGFSVASPDLFPSIRFTGQTADQSGTGVMNVAETEIEAGGGAQTSSSQRWGDYSMLAVDPSDDRTFWFTTEYYAATSGSDFRTRIGAVAIEEPPAASLAASATETELAPGDTTVFSYTVFNNTGEDLTGDVWYVARRDGEVTGEAILASGTFPPGAGETQTFTESFAAAAPLGDYTYTFNVGDYPDLVLDSDSVVVTLEMPTSSDGPPAASPSAAVVLEAPYPNPARLAATVSFSLPSVQRVRLVVYDVLGREVAVLAEGERAPGVHAVAVDGTGLPSGRYLVQLEANGTVQTQAFTLLR